MGCGKNGTFDIMPELTQWAMLSVHENILQKEINVKLLYGPFIQQWINLFAKETLIIQLNPISGHGSWDGKNAFASSYQSDASPGPIATLTRATIRINKLKHFWKNVAPVANKMTSAKGYRFSVGIGEIPWIKQATFSIWDSEEDMKHFAYKMKEHSEVIKKTRKEKWYSEDMFVRFKVISVVGEMANFSPVKINH